MTRRRSAGATRLGWLCAYLLLAAGALLFFSVRFASGGDSGAGLRIGSKNFTESIVVSELVRIDMARRGIQLEHRRALGGTAILWHALRAGDIDMYPEYTGTLLQELLRDLPADADLAALRAALAPLGLGLSAPLGFDDGYALGMRAGRAAQLHVTRLSDLAAQPGLRFGFSNEFMQRQDGWPGLRRAYGLHPASVRGMSHELAYRALAEGAVDVVDVYTTDAEIPYYDLRVLSDDRHYFPAYQAVLLYRLDALQRAPALQKALHALADRIDLRAMQAMNAAVKLHGVSETDAAAQFLQLRADDAHDGLAARLWARTGEHLRMVALSLALAILSAVPLGVLAAHRPRIGRIVLALSSVLQTVPSLAMLVFMIPLFGIGARPAIAALFLYSLLPIVRNTQAGLAGIPGELRESAVSLGLPYWTRLRRIELPLARGSILAGIKTAAVINVGTATLGALIGAGGYGEPILTGIRLDDVALILEGAIPAALLALLVQWLFEGVERALTPRGLRLKTAP